MCDPYEVYGLPHGNSRYSTESYQPAMASDREVRRSVQSPRRQRRPEFDGLRQPRVRQLLEDGATLAEYTSPHGLPMFPTPDRLVVYSTDPFPSTQTAAHVLRFSPDAMFNRQWAKIQLPVHVSHASFLVDLTALERHIDIHIDAYGALKRRKSILQNNYAGSWGIPGSFSNFYDADDEKQQLIRKDCGDVERRTRPDNFEFRVQCCRYNHPSEPKFRKIIYKLIDNMENPLRGLVWFVLFYTFAIH